MDQLPERLNRYPTRAGREALAARLGVTIGPYSQDWEYEIAEPERFAGCLALYREVPLSDDERFSLMMMLVECVENMVPWDAPLGQAEQLPEWQALAALLRANLGLHAYTIAYWSAIGREDREEQWRVSLPMRKVWAEVQASLAEQDSCG